MEQYRLKNKAELIRGEEKTKLQVQEAGEIRVNPTMHPGSDFVIIQLLPFTYRSALCSFADWGHAEDDL